MVNRNREFVRGCGGGTVDVEMLKEMEAAAVVVAGGAGAG